MTRQPRTPLLIVLLLLNAMVFLGQVWPEGAPPFARLVNMATLLSDLSLLAYLIRASQRKQGAVEKDASK